jgi:hypothetical protein
MTKQLSSHNDSRCLKCFTPYISEEGAAAMKQYRYKGGDLGITYRLFYNPLALTLVEYLPETLA